MAADLSPWLHRHIAASPAHGVTKLPEYFSTEYRRHDRFQRASIHDLRARPCLQSHPRFKEVASLAPLLFSRELQMGAEKLPKRQALGDAVQAGVIANETLAYFIGRTYLFLERIGVDTEVGSGVATWKFCCCQALELRAGHHAAWSICSIDLGVHLGLESYVAILKRVKDRLQTYCLCCRTLKRLSGWPQRLRFRQHLQHEMAHYAEDCWDAEVECSYGWVECAGLADRSAFDLRVSSAVPCVHH